MLAAQPSGVPSTHTRRHGSRPTLLLGLQRVVEPRGRPRLALRVAEQAGHLESRPAASRQAGRPHDSVCATRRGIQLNGLLERAAVPRSARSTLRHSKFMVTACRAIPSWTSAWPRASRTHLRVGLRHAFTRRTRTHEVSQAAPLRTRPSHSPASPPWPPARYPHRGLRETGAAHALGRREGAHACARSTPDVYAPAGMRGVPQNRV